MTDFLNNLDPDANFFDSVDLHSKCNYYSVSSFNIEFKDSRSFIGFHINIRSLEANWDELKSFLDDLNFRFSVLVITETWLDSFSLHYNLPGYRCFHTVRDKKGGGVSILVDECFPVEHLKLTCVVNENYEICSVQIRLGKELVNIFGVYRPPRGSLHEFNSFFF